MRALPADDGAQTLGDFELVAELGEAASTVFLGRRVGPRRFSRLVAIRRVGPFGPDDAEHAEAIARDLRAAAYVSHPSVLPLREVGADGEARYVVTDYVEGGSVADLMDACGGRIPPAIALAIALDALAGLEAVHRTESDGVLVHGRVSSQNLIVGADGRTRVADLGLVRAPRAERSGEPRASFQYLAPEAHDAPPDAAEADVFSLGIVLHEILAGHHPLATARNAAEARRMLDRPLPLLSAATASVPRPLAEIVARAVAADPRLRYPSAEAFALALERCMPRASASEVADFVDVHLGPRIEADRETARRWLDDRDRHRGHPPSIARRAGRRLELGERTTTLLSIAFAALLALGAVAVVGLASRDAPTPEVLSRWGAGPRSTSATPPGATSGDAQLGDEGVIVLGDDSTQTEAPAPRPERAPRRVRRDDTESLSNPYR
jgi:serine/threonine-protein kinase